ncbi:MAG: TetR/AcrR family transcriptional regulator [Turneriella sp.]|nr:TetR/AcrR family transcriptional regulator [Leptospiraceae bacterium]MCX7632884.1 TetR/AcrR family transcriptional regulator [Turneriella sp.]
MWGKACKKHPQESGTREAILRAASEEFAAHGFAGARTESIARAAGVNKAMLHYYFHDKETLYAAVLERIFGADSATELLIEKIQNAPLNALQNVHVFLRILLRKYADPRSDVFRRILAWELATGQSGLKSVAQKYLVPRLVAMAEVIRKGVEKGELDCPHPTLAVWSLIAQVAFYYMHRSTYEGSIIYEELYGKISEEQLLEFLLKSFIANYAKNSPVDYSLPPEILKLADELAEKLFNPNYEVAAP